MLQDLPGSGEERLVLRRLRFEPPELRCDLGFGIAGGNVLEQSVEVASDAGRILAVELMAVPPLYLEPDMHACTEQMLLPIERVECGLPGDHEQVAFGVVGRPL